MRPAGIGINGLAFALRVPATDTALRLGRYFSTTSEFRMNLRRDYDPRVAANASRARIEHDAQPRNAA